MKLSELLDEMELELLQKSDLFGTRVYTDEPIIKRASQLPKREPSKYDAMRKLGLEFDWSLPGERRVFYEQAKLMADFEDTYRFVGQFNRIFPTYRLMTLQQLRGYFSWRREVRAGKINDTAISFPFVYCYELLMLIGAKDEWDAYEKLKAFVEAMRDRHYSLSVYEEEWLADFAVYYGLPQEEYLKHCDISFDVNLGIFVNCRNETDEKLFEAVVALSAYDIVSSPFYAENKALYTAVVCRVIREQTVYYETHRKLGLAEKMFGRIVNLPYTVFASAVFYDARMYEDYTYTLCPLLKYTCKNGVWRLYRCTGRRARNTELGILIKSTEAYLRERMGFAVILPSANLTKPTLKIIHEAIDICEKEQKEREARTVSIDFSKLFAIRRASEQIKEKLMTDEERRLSSFSPEENDSPDGDTQPLTFSVNQSVQPEKVLPQSTDEDRMFPESADVLNPTARRFLCCLLAGEARQAIAFAKEQNRAVSLLSDDINEALFDEFADNVIVFEGDEPVILQDYEDDLKGRYLV